MKETKEDNGVSHLSKTASTPAKASHKSVDVTDHSEASSKYNWLFIFLLNFGLVVFLFAYAFMGGSVFQILEQTNEKEMYHLFLDARDVFRQSIANMSVCNATEDSIDMEQLDAEIDTFIHQMEEMICEENVNVKGNSKWTFWSSVFFSATVISTIGYGNIAPVTAGGRAFCMVYAVFGIALLLLVLASLGTLFARGATLGYRAMHLSVMMAKGQEIKPKRASRRRSSMAMVLRDSAYDDRLPVRQTSEEDRRQKTIDDIWTNDNKKPLDGKDALPMHIVSLKDEEAEIKRQKSVKEEEEEEEEAEDPDDDIQIPVLGVLIFAVMYICIVAGMLVAWEDEWTYYDAFYFSFITLTTIGFGDLVPQHQKNLLSITFFILLGMAIMSMCIALAQDAIMRKVAWASRKIGVAIIKSKPTGK